MKNKMCKAMLLMTLTLGLNTAHAENGGLMAEMMAKKFPAKTITDPAVQTRLSRIQIRNETHQSGGLMTELMAQRFPVKIIHSTEVQLRLAQVTIPAGK